MGYCVSINENNVKFKKENAEKILLALREFASNKDRLRWIDKEVLLDSDTSIEDVFEEIRYPLYEKGEYYEIDYFSGEKFGDEVELFNAIAKYIEPSYIEYCGEDGDIFRLVFDEETCKDVYPTVSWDASLLKRCSDMIGFLAEMVDVPVDGLDDLIGDINDELGIWYRVKHDFYSKLNYKLKEGLNENI